MTGTSIKSILAFALLVGVASQANADIWAHIDRQANDIERATKNLRGEVDHYRHTRFYGQLIGATARLKGQAIRVHAIADHSQCPKALKHAVRDLDRAFCDAEELFDRVEHSAAYGDGYIRGNTAHVKRQLNRIEACINNLKNDLRILNRGHGHVNVNHRPTYRPPVPAYRPPVAPVYNPPFREDIIRPNGFNHPAFTRGYRSYDFNRGFDRGYRGGQASGFGISIGGGSSRITLRF
jgi:hypothetical protein